VAYMLNRDRQGAAGAVGTVVRSTGFRHRDGSIGSVNSLLGPVMYWFRTGE
jgi:hypothetical protein